MNNTDTETPSSVIEAFFTRKPANEGKDFPLPLPDGTASGQTIKLVSAESDTFRKAQTERTKKQFDIITMPEAEQADARRKADTEMLAKCVVGWSMDTPFNMENVTLLLEEASYIREMVDNTITHRAAFFAKR